MAESNVVKGYFRPYCYDCNVVFGLSNVGISNCVLCRKPLGVKSYNPWVISSILIGLSIIFIAIFAIIGYVLPEFFLSKWLFRVLLIILISILGTTIGVTIHYIRRWLRIKNLDKQQKLQPDEVLFYMDKGYFGREFVRMACNKCSYSYYILRGEVTTKRCPKCGSLEAVVDDEL